MPSVRFFESGKHDVRLTLPIPLREQRWNGYAFPEKVWIYSFEMMPSDVGYIIEFFCRNESIAAFSVPDLTGGQFDCGDYRVDMIKVHYTDAESLREVTRRLQSGHITNVSGTMVTRHKKPPHGMTFVPDTDVHVSGYSDYIRLGSAPSDHLGEIRRPSVKQKPFCKHCDQAFEYDFPTNGGMWAAPTEKVDYCPKCRTMLRVAKAFEEVGRFLDLYEDIVESFWRNDPVVHAHIMKCAELTEGVDIEIAGLQCDGWATQESAWEHEEERDRRDHVEEHLFATDWGGHVTRWRATVLEVLRDQFQRDYGEWPLRGMWEWYKGDKVEKRFKS